MPLGSNGLQQGVEGKDSEDDILRTRLVNTIKMTTMMAYNDEDSSDDCPDDDNYDAYDGY